MLMAYLANKPAGADLVFLIVAVVLFAVATVVAVLERTWWTAIVAGGLLATVLAFLVS